MLPLLWNNFRHLLRRVGLVSEATPWQLGKRLDDPRVDGDLVERIDAAAAAVPRLKALEDSKQQFTYSQLLRRSASVAVDITALQPLASEAVAILMPPGARFFVVCLGVLRTGRAFLHLDPALAVDTLRDALRQTGASLILAHNARTLDLAKQVATERCDTSMVDLTGGSQPLPKAQPAAATNPNLPCCILLTSGSTGMPQCYAFSRAAVLGSALSTSRVARISSRDCLVVCAGPTFGFGLQAAFAALLSGASVRLCQTPGDDIVSTLDQALAPGATVLLTVPAVLRSVVTALKQGRSMPALRHVIVGGEPLHPADLREALETLPPSVVLEHRYGITEGGTLCRELFDRRSRINGDAPSVGRPVAGCQVWIEDDEGHRLAAGEAGNILAAKAQLNPRFVDGRLEPAPAQVRTGDWGRLKTDGRLEVLGRVDLTLKSRGIRVSAAEIERVILQDPAVSEAAVTAMLATTEKQNHGLTAWLVLRESAVLDVPGLRKALAAALPPEAIPARFVARQRLPRLPNGKVDRPTLASTVLRPETPEVQPRSRHETELMAILTEALPIKPRSVHDDFFALGGDSLSIAAVALEISKHFAVEVSPEKFYARPTISEMAELLMSKSRAKEEAGTVLISLHKGRREAPVIFFPGGDANAKRLAKARAALMDAGVAGSIFGFAPLPWMQERPEFESLGGLVREVMPQLVEVLRQFSKPGILFGFCVGGRVAAEAAIQLASLPRLEFPLPRLVLRDTPAEHFQALRLAKPDREEDLERDPVAIAYSRLVNAWEPADVPVPVDLLINEDFRRRSANPTLGWERCAKAGLRVHATPGSHNSSFHEDRPAFVSIIRRVLTACEFLETGADMHLLREEVPV